LEELHLAMNKIEVIPEALHSLSKSLTTISLFGNKLSLQEIKKLHPDFFPKLERLSIHENPLGGYRVPSPLRTRADIVSFFKRLDELHI